MYTVDEQKSCTTWGSKEKKPLEKWDKPFKTYKNLISSHDKTTFPSTGFLKRRDFWLKNPSSVIEKPTEAGDRTHGIEVSGCFFGGMEI